MAGIAIYQVRQYHISRQLTLWMMLLFFGWSCAGYAQSVLEAIEVTNLSGGRTQLRFRLSGPIQTPRSFTINDPARIVLDFPNTRNGLTERQQSIRGSVADRVNVLEAGNRTRASINLSRPVPFTVNTDQDAVVVLLGATGTTTAAPPSISRTPPRVASQIDFRRGINGEGIISVRLSDPSTPVSVRQEGNRIIADFQRAPFPRGQERRLDVTDFATPVTLIDIQNQENDGRLVIQPTGRYEYLAYQADDLYTIEVKPVQEVEEEQQEDPLDPRRQPKFTGDLLSLNFQDIEVRAVLQIIADFTGQNVVVSDTVQGNLTLRLQNVPWDQALDIILRTKGLTLRQTGNVMYIAPTEEVAARERLLLEARKTVNELEPLRTEIIQINFAKADELRNLIMGASQGAGAGAAAGAAGGGGADSLLSSRGKVNVDVRTNSLLVQDIAAKIAEIRALVARLDIPVRQVMIDSRVVIANDDFSKELGIRWGVTAVRQTGNEGIITASGSLQGTSTIVDSAIANLTNSGQPFPVALPDLGQRLGVNLGVADPLGRLGLALLGKNYLVDLELSALQTEGRGEVLSNPRVLTTDRNKAFIKQGREIPYQTVTDDGAVQTEFKEALLELEVVPQIAPDGTIILDLKIKKDEQGELVPSALGSLIPTIQKREVQTQVRVDNGQTVVLGGVFEQITSDTLDKVPFLGDLPAIGRLFQRRGNRDNKLELLIFVTPQIINDGQIANANR